MPDELAAEARASVDAGARVLHLHPYDADGLQTLAAEPCAAAIRAVRAVCPGIPISLSTSAEIEPDPARRRSLVAAWTELPELVTANQGEEGIAELCDVLLERGIGIEAGLLVAHRRGDLRRRRACPDHCVRAMVEPLGEDPTPRSPKREAIETVLTEARIPLEQVHHGDGLASWAVNRRGAARGHGIRTGLEDTPVLPDGSLPRKRRAGGGRGRDPRRARPELARLATALGVAQRVSAQADDGRRQP